MVNIIENYAKASGLVKSIKLNDKLPGYHQIELELSKTEDVHPFPNLARADEGKKIKINIKSEILKIKAVKRNQLFTAEIRKASGQVYFMK